MTVTLRLTQQQASDLAFLLSINARRDCEREREAWAKLEDIPKLDQETKAKFSRNADFYDELIETLGHMQELLATARGLR